MMLLRSPWLAVCYLLFPVSAAAGSLRSAHWSLRSVEPAYEAWQPPPEYASKTWGHKTMYLADVAIGSSRQRFRMLIDTGSWLSVVPGMSCNKAGCPRDRRYDTRNASGGNQTASIMFEQGAVAGHIFGDIVCAGRHSTHLTEVGFLQRRATPKGGPQQMPDDLLDDLVRGSASHDGAVCARMSFLVADTESADFADAPYDGILGLGLRGDSASSQAGDQFSLLKQLASQGRVRDSIFALRLGNQGQSELIFGNVDESSLVGKRLLWVPLDPAADGHWQISVSDLTLDGVRQHVGDMEVIVDSGTSLLAPDKDLADWMKARLTPGDCDTVNQLPKLGFRLSSGSILTMLPSDFIDHIDGKCSLSVMPLNIDKSGVQASTYVPPRLILGDSFLRRYTTVFDLHQRRLGFGVESGMDLAKELAESLFPEAPANSFDDDSTEPGKTLPAMPGLAGHIHMAKALRSKKNAAHQPVQPNAKIGLNASSTTVDAEERAGYNYVQHLWKHKTSRSSESPHATRSGKEKPSGDIIQDRLRAVGKNLDGILATLNNTAKPPRDSGLAPSSTIGDGVEKTNTSATKMQQRAAKTSRSQEVFGDQKTSTKSLSQDVIQGRAKPSFSSTSPGPTMAFVDGDADDVDDEEASAEASLAESIRKDSSGIS